MEENKISKLSVMEKDREFTKVIGNDSFTVRIPLPTQKATIISRTARALGGLSVESYLPEDYEYIRMLVTLNEVIVESPDLWEGADVCPDEALLGELWSFFITSGNSFQESLKKNNRKKESK